MEETIQKLEEALDKAKREKAAADFINKYLEEKNLIMEPDTDVVIEGKKVGIRIRAL